MKAKEYDRVRTLVEVKTGMSDRTWPAGTKGTIVDVPREGEPEYYAVDVGESQDEYDNIVLAPDQFEVVES